jgi:hypothetical protein
MVLNVNCMLFIPRTEKAKFLHRQSASTVTVKSLLFLSYMMYVQDP